MYMLMIETAGPQSRKKSNKQQKREEPVGRLYKKTKVQRGKNFLPPVPKKKKNK